MGIIIPLIIIFIEFHNGQQPLSHDHLSKVKFAHLNFTMETGLQLNCVLSTGELLTPIEFPFSPPGQLISSRHFSSYTDSGVSAKVCCFVVSYEKTW